MKDQVSVIIHSAWDVNFKLSLRSFEQQHIKGLYHLINFSLSVRRSSPARFFFCSSVSTIPQPLKSELITDLASGSGTGYANYKLVCEHMLLKASTSAGASTCILRIGRIIGDKSSGMWNNTEAIPLMIRTALANGTLPSLDKVSKSHLP